MKYLNLKLLLTAIFACAVSVSMAQKSAKEAIKYAESIEFGKEIIDLQFPIEQYSYIPKDKGNHGILSIDGNPMLRGGLIPAGIHVLQLHYEDFNYNSSRSVRMITENRQVNFEAGKSYSFARQKSGKQELVIEEDSDSKLEYIKTLIAYTEANPDRLNGTWNGEKKRLMNTFSMQYSIDGNRIIFAGKNKTIGKTFVAEGRLLYNENVIIMFPEKATANGKEIENFSEQPKYIWYYTIIDNKLHLEGGSPFGTTFRFENTGEFHKTN